jgi:hypothetical protein
MKIYELFEASAKKASKIVIPPTTPRNPVAANSHITARGAGSHTPSKFTRKSKHKNKDISIDLS